MHWNSSLSTDEATLFSQANRKQEWRAAMAEEINALLKNGTWVLVLPLPTLHKVGCKMGVSNKPELGFLQGIN